MYFTVSDVFAQVIGWPVLRCSRNSIASTVILILKALIAIGGICSLSLSLSHCFSLSIALFSGVSLALRQPNASLILPLDNLQLSSHTRHPKHAIFMFELSLPHAEEFLIHFQMYYFNFQMEFILLLPQRNAIQPPTQGNQCLFSEVTNLPFAFISIFY